MAERLCLLLRVCTLKLRQMVRMKASVRIVNYGVCKGKCKQEQIGARGVFSLLDAPFLCLVVIFKTALRFQAQMAFGNDPFPVLNNIGV